MMSAKPMKRGVRAFVLVKAKPGSEKDIAEKLLRYDEVKETHLITGKWDLMTVLEVPKDIVAPSQEKVVQFVLDKVGKIKGVLDTSTIVAEFSRTKFTESV